MFEFSTVREAGKNFRPSWLIIEYAKKNNLKTIDCYGSTCLIGKNGYLYDYNGYRIQDNKDGTETVTVIMILKEK